MASNNSFNKDTVALEVVETYPSQVSQKIVLVTGVSTGGIGDAVTRAFAHGGASTIIVAGRSDERLAEVIKTLSSDYPSTRFRPLKFNYHSLRTVRAAAQEILDDESVPQLDILVGNAGASVFGPRVVTEDGIEQHFAGYVAHLLFTTLLVPKLRLSSNKNPPGSTRIVFLSSGAMNASPIRFSDWNFEEKPIPEDEKPDWTIFKVLGAQETDEYSHHIAYAQCNTAKTLITVQLNKLLASSGIFSFSLHPGSVRSTGASPLWDSLADEQKAIVEAWDPFKSIEQGAATVLVAALDPGLNPKNGAFLTNCQVTDPPPYAADPEKAESLWKLTEDVLGSKIRV